VLATPKAFRVVTMQVTRKL